MKNALTLSAVFLALLCCGCELPGPDKIQARVQSALQPYFPQAQAIMFPKEEAIVGLTCLNEAGPKLISEVQGILLQNSDVQQLRRLRKWAPRLGGTSYKYFAIGFPHEILTLDVDAWQIAAIKPGREYEDKYRVACGISHSNEEPASYAWIGQFEIVFTDANGKQRTDRVFDGLGVYSLTDFPSYESTELRSREWVIREHYRRQNATVGSVRLLSIKHVPVMGSSLNDQQNSYR